MIQKSIIAILLISTWAQTLTLVSAFESDDAAAFTQPMTQLTGVTSGFTPKELVGGAIPDATSLTSGGGGGLLKKRDEGDLPAQSGSGLAISSGDQNDSGSPIGDDPTSDGPLLSLRRRGPLDVINDDPGAFIGSPPPPAGDNEDGGETAGSGSTMDAVKRSGDPGTLDQAKTNDDNATLGKIRQRSVEKVSMASGAEQMARARQGVVVEPQDISTHLAKVKRRMVKRTVKSLKEKANFGAGN
ncbi:hypothetical protein BC941DRAFT_412816 [Chlamydoabsidia padenii]|nr:hypothetical protein BC941DRAFT_412816 [Chlamydoabsidia padenii]